jgi:nucleotide-binding universal stress UspA family protein
LLILQEIKAMKKNLKKILIPVDFKVPSKKAVDYAGMLAKRQKTEVTLFYVIDTPGLLAQLLSFTTLPNELDFTSFFKPLSIRLDYLIIKEVD